MMSLIKKLELIGTQEEDKPKGGLKDFHDREMPLQIFSKPWLSPDLKSEKP